jgi:hypothetical protein
MNATASDTASAIAASRMPGGVLTRLMRPFVWIARREALACGLVLCLTLGIRAALLPWMPPPIPGIHDEMSYLLAADTYASGRLANPPHPFWQHFETFHVLQQPTYASKYQPLQGMVLAFGQKFFGKPWVGVYLSAGVMCAAVCWMLQGWLAAEWALLGAVLFMSRVGIFQYWMNSYWGGAVPAIGGALALGALARMWRRDRLGHSATWAAGLAILMLSRPYDAVVLALGTGAVLLWWLHKSKTSVSTAAMRIVLPAAAVLAVAGAMIAYNNYRVTGSALVMPYQLHDRQYAVAPMFFPLPLRPEPEYRHLIMRNFWTQWNVEQWKTTRADPFTGFLLKVSTLNDFFFGLWPYLIPPLIWPYRLKSTEEKVTVFLLVVFLISIAALIGIEPHYAAAICGLFFVRFVQTLIRLHDWRPSGRRAGLAAATLFVAMFGFQFTTQFAILAKFGVEVPEFGLQRALIIQQLMKEPGRQLVMVRYKPDHRVHDEWVYNRADIDAAPIVWAREMTPQQDRPFLEYFHDRRVWLLEPDQSPPKLTPYMESRAEAPGTGEAAKTQAETPPHPREATR